MAVRIDGKAVAGEVRSQVAREVATIHTQTGRQPGLATVLISDDPASHTYVSAKRRACVSVGIESFHHALPAEVSRMEVMAIIDRLNEDPAVDGILCQLPLPAGLNALEVTNRIARQRTLTV